MKVGAPFPMVHKKYWSGRLYKYILQFKGDFESVMDQAGLAASLQVRDWASDPEHPHHVKGVSKALEYALKKKESDTQKEIAFANLPSREEALQILKNDRIAQIPATIEVKPLEDYDED